MWRGEEQGKGGEIGETCKYIFNHSFTDFLLSFTSTVPNTGVPAYIAGGVIAKKILAGK